MCISKQSMSNLLDLLVKFTKSFIMVLIFFDLKHLVLAKDLSLLMADGAHVFQPPLF